MFLRIAANLTCYSIGAWVITRPSLAWWIVGVGAVGFVIAEIASGFSEDYYQFRRGRGDSAGVSTLTAKLDPPQLMLKGSWGFYLVAFLFALLVAIAMAESGWPVMVFAGVGFLFGYVPFSLRSSNHLIGALRDVSSSWIPYFSAIYISGGKATIVGLVVVGLIFLVGIWRTTSARE